MSYEQIKQRMVALQHDQEKYHNELTQITGARRELQFIIDQMVPGLDHEMMEERRKAMDKNLQVLNQNLMVTQGGLKETAYWLSQTMAGQEPDEAIRQLAAREMAQGDEGPLTDFEQMELLEAAGQPVGETASEEAETPVLMFPAAVNGKGELAEIPVGAI